jgi:hypothetical protein
MFAPKSDGRNSSGQEHDFSRGKIWFFVWNYYAPEHMLSLQDNQLELAVH